MKKIITLTLTLTLALTIQAQTELTSAEAKALYKSTQKKYVSVHDPSVVYDSISKRYYIFGSHKAGAYTTDMQNWTQANPRWKVGNNNDASNASAFTTPAVTTVMKGGQQVSLPAFNAMEWSARTDAGYNINGNMWAPDVVWNKTMQKWCMYLSINGDGWHSSIILLTANSISGPWTYQAPVVICGFQDSGHSYKGTDLEVVLGTQASLPSRYNVGNGWGRRWPHTIDPCVFYDEQDRLWMIYGSWSGGLWMLELDEATGLRDYDVVYPSTNGNSDGVTSDPYFGKKVAGGYYVSGEGSYIEYVGGYYYLFVSYGFFDSVGGYVMRVFRSQNPDGPYKDAAGNNAIFTSYKMNYGKNADNRGVKIMGAYADWGFMGTGELSQGHNSVIAAPDGRTYLVYHTRFNDGGEGHLVRVHQLLQTKNGWLVASPFEYNGSTLTDAQVATEQPFTTDEIAGTYQLLRHKYDIDYANREVVTPVEVTLHADGTLSGAYNGTWSIEEGTAYITLRFGGANYMGVIAEQQMDYQSVKSIAFSALATNGVCIWGYKMHPKYALAWQVNNQKVPVSAGMSVSKNVDLSTIWLGDANVDYEWTSSHPDIISETGRYNPTGQQDDQQVTLTVRLSSPAAGAASAASSPSVPGGLPDGGWYWQKEYTVRAWSEERAAPVVDWTSGMLAHYGFDDDALANSLNPEQQAQLKRNNVTALPSLSSDDALRNGNYVHLAFGANKRESYVEMPNPLSGKALDKGATLAFWVRRTDNNLYDGLYGFVNNNARLFMTGNLYTGFNDGAGNWLDINHPDAAQPTNLTVGLWRQVTVVFERQATVSTGGVTVYIDGVRKSADKFNGALGETAVTAKAAFDYNHIVNLLSNSPYLYLGYGSFWGSPDASFDDVVVYDRPLDAAQVKALNTMMNRVFNFATITGISDAPYLNGKQPTTSSNAIYDLQGRRYSHDRLPKGLYIINGKKTIIR
jgi:arabinan endo-1,5-alpha-L-arabinosidase